LGPLLKRRLDLNALHTNRVGNQRTSRLDPVVEDPQRAEDARCGSSHDRRRSGRNASPGTTQHRAAEPEGDWAPVVFLRPKSSTCQASTWSTTMLTKLQREFAVDEDVPFYATSQTGSI